MNCNIFKKILTERASRNATKDMAVQENAEKERYKKCNGNSRNTFGDFFVRENFNTTLKPELPSKYTSFSPSAEFRIEAERAHYQKMERAAIRKIDFRVIPWAASFFFLSFLDRLNIGNLKVSAFPKDLNLSDYDFSLSITMTFIAYLIVELPSNLLIARIGAGKYIPVLAITWGIITFCHGFLTNSQGLAAARFMLGLAEGGLYPGLVLYLSGFYTRAELQLRIAMFFSTVCLAGMSSGFLTSGITKLDGALGLAGWAWVFIIEGIVTFACGISGFFLMAKAPADVKFLTKEEKNIILSRLVRDRSPGDEDDTFLQLEPREPTTSMGFQVIQAIKSPHVLLCSVAFFFAGFNVHSMAYFGPSIVGSFGYEQTDTQLLTVPPYFLAFCLLLMASYLSDKYSARSLFTIVATTFSTVGFLTFYLSDDNFIRYGSIFFTISGVYTIIPSLMAWLENNSEPYPRKATSIALGPTIGNFGGIASVWVFAVADKPLYSKPTVINIAFSILIALCCIINLAWLIHSSRRKIDKRQKILERFNIDNDFLDQESRQKLYWDAWERLGDRHPDFKYTY